MLLSHPLVLIPQLRAERLHLALVPYNERIDLALVAYCSRVHLGGVVRARAS